MNDFKNKKKEEDIPITNNPEVVINQKESSKEDSEKIDFIELSKEEVMIQIESNKAPLKLSLRGNYLPDVLVKLGEFITNTDARKYLRVNGIYINGDFTKNIDFPLNKGITYNIKVKEDLFEITII